MKLSRSIHPRLRMIESPGRSGSQSETESEGKTTMDSDREYRSGRVPLPGLGDAWQADPADPPGPPAPARGPGLKQVRRMSNWTAAALIVGTGAATVALAHQALPGATSAAGGGTTTGAGAAATTGAGAAAGATGPKAVHSVATTNGSGVTTTTTTRVVNGKTVVSHVRHVPAYHDN